MMNQTYPFRIYAGGEDGCMTCGAMVHDAKLHAVWHWRQNHSASNGKAASYFYILVVEGVPYKQEPQIDITPILKPRKAAPRKKAVPRKRAATKKAAPRKSTTRRKKA